jgi:uncharacterized protein (TIGR02996 family)
MSEEERFLQALRESPDDAGLKAVYADWLEDRGDARAEFVRLLNQRAEATARLEQLTPGLDPEWVRRVSGRVALTIQQVPAPTDLPRVESGAVQFGNDWPGLFLRGDHAHSAMTWIQRLVERLAGHPDPDVADILHLLMGYADVIRRHVIV